MVNGRIAKNTDKAEQAVLCTALFYSAFSQLQIFELSAFSQRSNTHLAQGNQIRNESGRDASIPNSSKAFSIVTIATGDVKTDRRITWHAY